MQRSTYLAAAAAKSLQSCPTLCDPIDDSPPGSPVPGILQARTVEWVAISFSSAWKWKVKGKSLSHVQLVATPWTAAYQAPPSMGLSRQEYWSGVPLPSPYLSWGCPKQALYVNSGLFSLIPINLQGSESFFNLSLSFCTGLVFKTTQSRKSCRKTEIPSNKLFHPI